VNTVKTHLRHVYDKLGVHRRHDAVEQARALGLLAPSPRRPYQGRALGRPATPGRTCARRRRRHTRAVARNAPAAPANRVTRTNHPAV